jgi:hypothetical protein
MTTANNRSLTLDDLSFPSSDDEMMIDDVTLKGIDLDDLDPDSNEDLLDEEDDPTFGAAN